MIRITGGEWCGRKILTCRGLATRPTSARVRQALFNILAAEVPGARFADLCCGAGTVGLEALSRGAEHCVFVEHNPAAVAVLRKNLERLGAMERATIIRADALKWLAAVEAAAGSQRVDIAFCDPPYRSGLLRKVLPLLGASHSLVRGGWVVAEAGHGLDLAPLAPPSLALVKTRLHGTTRLWIWRLRSQ